MYQIRLVRKIKGKDIMDGLKKEYGSLDNLKKLYKEDKENPIFYFHLEEWDHYKDRLDKDITQRKIIFAKNYPIGKIELKLLDLIKTTNPESIRDLARLSNKDIKTVQPKVNALAEEGIIELKNGSKNNKIPVFPYDYMEIVIGESPIAK
ncbi:MAG: hypothetical protein FWE58_03225 [Methanobrevibacter sp.]|nr:hypothetical protein [Methanobrevibacter sp.]